MSSTPVGLIAGRYRLKGQVGTGNMSTVYEAEDTRRGHRIVAVKLLNTQHDDALKREIFRRETRALSQLEHPHIVTVLDYNWSDEHHAPYLVFDYLPRTPTHMIGDTCCKYPLQEKRELDSEDACFVMRCGSPA